MAVEPTPTPDETGEGHSAVVETTTIRAEKLIGGGRALGHAGGETWMIQGALPGELVRAIPTRRRAGIVESATVELVADPSPARLDLPCRHSGSCGGCDWPHVHPNAGAELKRTVASEAAARFPEIAERLSTAPVTPSPPGYRLRNRLHWDPDSGRFGFYRSRSWAVAEIDDCRIISTSLTRILPGLTEVLARRCPRRVDVETLEGAGQVIAALRPARGGPKRIPIAWIPDRGDCPALDGLHILDTANRLHRCWGRDRVTMDLPVPLDVPLGSFFQGNLHLVRRLFDTVGALVGPGEDPVIDLHGGVGFLAAAAHTAGRSNLTVVEPNPGAAAAARTNLPNAAVSVSTAEAFVHEHGLPRRSVVITDPPRSGLTAALRDRLVRHRPRRVIMLGCDPSTWSRDTARLLEAGAVLDHVELVDLFPFTHHVEVLAALEWT
ncbi:MAG: hypothetical protein V2I67_02665 [Thermoanaerobaculales bacterium]|jgi:tRNA/tmRNA/rRNA uracil-C5-methylase (TrmA/RlmC/RlmD family)|nr:hypothetical protein [Thermoanaerobaculales bacterium]